MKTIFTEYRDNGVPQKEAPLYDFSYLEDEVKQWKGEITGQMINLLPYGLNFYLMIDPLGNEINDIDRWLRERDEFINYLKKKYTNERQNNA